MKAKELDDLKRSYKEGMDELTTLRTKVGHTEKCSKKPDGAHDIGTSSAQ